MGYEFVQEMDDEHDNLHLTLCVAFHQPSYSMKVKDGAALTPEEEDLARMEEHAVLMVQRWLQHLRKRNGENSYIRY